MQKRISNKKRAVLFFIFTAILFSSFTAIGENIILDEEQIEKNILVENTGEIGEVTEEIPVTTLEVTEETTKEVEILEEAEIEKNLLAENTGEIGEVTEETTTEVEISEEEAEIGEIKENEAENTGETNIQENIEYIDLETITESEVKEAVNKEEVTETTEEIPEIEEETIEPLAEQIGEIIPNEEQIEKNLLAENTGEIGEVTEEVTPTTKEVEIEVEILEEAEIGEIKEQSKEAETLTEESYIILYKNGKEELKIRTEDLDKGIEKTENKKNELIKEVTIKSKEHVEDPLTVYTDILEIEKIKKTL